MSVIAFWKKKYVYIHSERGGRRESRGQRGERGGYREPVHEEELNPGAEGEESFKDSS